MAGTRANSQCRSAAAFAILLVAVLLFAPLVAARPVASGWDVSRSTGSSDAKLWRKFTTHAQATSYHRLLLDLETKRVEEKIPPPAAGTQKVEKEINQDSDDDFNTMDYANPRSNEPGSSDSSSPTTP